MNISQPDTKHIPFLRTLWKEAFGDTDAFLDTFFSTAFSPERARCVFEANMPIAVLYWFDCEYEGQPMAYLYAIATSASHQGQGLCTQLMEDTHKYLASLGYSGILLVPGGNHLFDFYRKIGYETACYLREFSCTAEDQNLSLRPLSCEEYASLRRKVLPMGSVVQEGANLAFLQTEYDFYAGEDFLLTAKITDNHLYGIELLGNSESAPGLVHALNCTGGLFRAPGSDKPFAMYLPLGQTMQTPPSYLGFAFD